jgi:hypothetical protein
MVGDLRGREVAQRGAVLGGPRVGFGELCAADLGLGAIRARGDRVGCCLRSLVAHAGVEAARLGGGVLSARRGQVAFLVLDPFTKLSSRAAEDVHGDDQAARDCGPDSERDRPHHRHEIRLLGDAATRGSRRVGRTHSGVALGLIAQLARIELGGDHAYRDDAGDGEQPPETSATRPVLGQVGHRVAERVLGREDRGSRGGHHDDLRQRVVEGLNRQVHQRQNGQRDADHQHPLHR